MYHDVTEIFQTLTKAGAIPGADFSIDPVDGSLRMNETSYNLLNNLYPEIDWDDVTAVMQPDSQDAIRTLHEHLDINFVERLVERIHLRLSELPQAKAAWYLTQVLSGVEKQTGIPLHSLLTQNIEASRFFYIEMLLREQRTSEVCNDWLGDLIIAAGGHQDDFEYQGRDVLLTEKGLRLLATVWTSNENLYEQLIDEDSSESDAA